MRKVLKWLGIGIGSLLVLILVAAAALYALGRSRFSRTYIVNGLIASVPTDSATVARGAHLALTHGCLACHGIHLAGAMFLDVPPFRMVATNLTRGNGGIGGAYSIQDWDRAIRHGVRPTGKQMLVMPSQLFHDLSDADASAVIAYLKSVPPVDSVLEPSRIKWLGYVVLAMASDKEIGPWLDAPPHEAPAIGPTAAYGKYLAANTCVECHGQDLHGGKSPDANAPPSPSLIPAAFWSVAEFSKLLRTGIHPDGRQLSEFMPRKDSFEHLDDVEIEALQEYIKALAATKL